jgi:IS30 family transposase
MIGERNPRWNGGTSQYPNHAEFKRKRKEILQQQDKCVFCGGKAEQIHHLDGSKDNHSLENLVPVCTKCHLQLHSKIRNGQKGKTKYKNIYGFNLDELAKGFNVSHSTIINWIKKEDHYKSKIKNQLTFYRFLESKREES